MNDQHGKGTAVAAQDFDLAELVKDLRKQVSLLEDDLRARSEEVDEFATALRTEYDEAFAAKRIAATYEAWRDDRVTQVAAAWVLGTVFVRYCEDNDLIEWPFIAGPGEKLIDAEERHEKFFREHPELNDRDWIIEAFNHLAGTNPTVAGLFDKKHNPLWKIMPSFEAATALLGFWRRRGDDGEIRYCLTGSDTRFLGDLYQDLSIHAQKTYALLQTPVFVEEFILDLTVEPAVDEFGLADLRTIDPACGSGHFLLGLFHRLLNKWRNTEPGTDDWELIRRSLASVHGCDKNPFAVSIARFRLLIAALTAAKIRLLNQAREFPLNVAVGDSLIHGRGVSWKQRELNLFNNKETYTYQTEDVNNFVASCDLLGLSSYHVVVGNPPYITVKDKRENETYRDIYKEACAGKYALSAPFIQRLFDLAIRTHGADSAAGIVGQITANSFMKREFGKKLVENYLPTINLTHIIDTSGAYIPGHGTPTVILVGKNHIGRAELPIRAILGIRGEPTQPNDPALGLVWQSIIKLVENPNEDSEWVSAIDAKRQDYSMHPWSISGGGSGELFDLLSESKNKLGQSTSRIGFYGVVGADDAMAAPKDAFRRDHTEAAFHQALTVGDEVRDWATWPKNDIFYPYGHKRQLIPLSDIPQHARRLWPFRTNLGNRATFTKGTYFTDNRAWYEWHQLPKDSDAHTWAIAFSFVATHNHFSLDREQALFNRTAPIIKLTPSADENYHLGLVGVLNSSTACFWLKQVCHNKGNSTDALGARTTGVPYFDSYEFTGTKLQEFPLPSNLPVRLSKALETAANLVKSNSASLATEYWTPSADQLDVKRHENQRLRKRMISVQEEIDWETYISYDLLSKSERKYILASDIDTLPEIGLGERAFEILLARKVAAGEAEDAWFTRHGSTPITEIPSHWPEWYQQIVQARIDIIEKRKDIALIERPECKRRWAAEPWEKKEAEALRTWLLDRCETKDIWFTLRDGMKQPRTLTVSQLADQFRDDADMNSVAQLYAADHLGKRDLTLAQVLEQVVADQHVPYLAAMRYKDSGLRKREQWERVWEMQREEDRTGERLDIPVPPKYGNPDFRKTSYWSQRGKLDVPKERFVSYPDANPDADPTLLLGWAGWDHKDQAQALVNIVNDRVEQASWGTDKLTPLLAGLRELMPWVHQWHGEYDDAWGGTPSEEYQTFLDDQRTKQQLTEDDLRAWRPVAGKRGRRVTTKDDQQ